MDPDLKSWAGQTLPTLQEHLKMAEEYSAAGQKTGAKSASAQ
jgi:hypothetical protein